MVSGPVYILQTYFSPSQHPAHCFRIEAGWNQDPKTPARDRVVFVTGDKEVYADALDCEGMDVKVMVQWHREPGWRVADKLQLASWIEDKTQRKEG